MGETAADQTQRPETKPETDRNVLSLAEAALYVAGRPLDLKTIGSVVGTRSKSRIKTVIRTLAEEYTRKGGALEILELDDERFVFQLKPEYVIRVKRLSLRPLLSQASLKTLAYISYRQPVAQAHVALVRGAMVYSQIRELKNLGLISMEKLGKTQILRTTDVFSDYFNLSRDPRLMRRQLKALFDKTEKVEEEKT